MANGKQLNLPYFSTFPLSVDANATLGNGEYFVVGKRSPDLKWDYSTYATIKEKDIITATFDK